MLYAKEFYEVMKQFEKTELAEGYSLDKENKSDWKRKHYYQNGMLNKLFQMYLLGYSFGKTN